MRNQYNCFQSELFRASVNEGKQLYHHRLVFVNSTIPISQTDNSIIWHAEQRISMEVSHVDKPCVSI